MTMAIGLIPAMIGGGGLSTPGGNGGTLRMPVLVARTRTVTVPSAVLTMNASVNEGCSTMATGTDPVGVLGPLIATSAPDGFWLRPSKALGAGDNLCTHTVAAP